MRIPIQKIMKFPCYIKSGITYDEYSQPTYTKTEETRCFFAQEQSKLVKDSYGADQIINGMFYIERTAKIEADDKIVFEGTTYRIINNKKCKDIHGKLTHYQIAVIVSGEEALTI